MSVSNINNTKIFNNVLTNEKVSVESPAYKEMTRRLPQNELQEIERILTSVKELDTTRFLQALETPDWSFIGSTHNFPYIALKALKDGQITSGQFSTVQFFWMNLVKHKALKIIPLFDKDGDINEVAKLLILESLKQTKIITDQSGLFKKQDYNLLDDFQLSQFYEEMKKLPLSEQNFFVVKNIPIQTDHLFWTIANLEVLPFMYVNNQRDYMIPSHGMMQTFLNVKFGKDAVEINPVLGLSTEEDIRNNGRTSKRDLALRFPGTTIPNVADGNNNAQHFGFTLHDFYHATMASFIPCRYRVLFIQIADRLNKINTQVAKRLSAFLIDMEIPYYRYDITIRPTLNNPSFWQNLSHYFSEPDHYLFWGGLMASLFMTKRNLNSFQEGPLGYSLDKEDTDCVENIVEIVPDSFSGLSRFKTRLENQFQKLLLSKKYAPSVLEDALEKNPITVLHKAWTQKQSFSLLFH